MTTAELLAVGDELLYGDIVNGNAAWLGQRLAEVGVTVSLSVVVGDDVEAIADAVTRALARADAVVLTGGLGPTQDDLTREALSRAAGVGLRRDAGLEAQLRQRFSDLRRDVPEMNYRQADLPEGAEPIPNGRGTAPGLRFELLGGVAYALPGVPHEMQAMVTDTVLPDLLRASGDPAVVVHRVLRTAGMWESVVAEAMAPEIDRLAAAGAGNPTVAFLASGGQTRVRVTARAATREQAYDVIAPTEAFARDALGPGLYGVDGDTLEGVVVAELAARGATVAVAESLTGGLLAGRLTDVAGVSSVLRGGVVAYATDVKGDVLEVPRDVLSRHGAVSGQTAAAMAEGVRARLQATFGLSTTGVAGPDEQEGKPVGTVYLGLAGPDGTTTRALQLPGDRGLVRTYTVVSALDLLRRLLAGTLSAEPDGPTGSGEAR